MLVARATLVTLATLAILATLGIRATILSPPPVDFGIFARKWANAEGVLDLKAQTYSGSEAFSAQKAEGEGADAVFTVTFGDKACTLKLTDAGTLGLFGEGEEPEKTFMVVPESLAGAWATDDIFSYTAYVIDPTPNDEGLFPWTMISSFNGEVISSDTGDTVFSVEDGEPAITFHANEGGYPSYVFVKAEDSFTMTDYFDTTSNVTPFEFPLEAGYLSGNGDRLTVADEEITFNGTKTTLAAEATEQGAGYAFSAGSKEYLLQLIGSATYLVGEKTSALSPYDAAFIVGDWYSADGSIVVSADDDTEVTVAAGGKTETVPLTVRAEDGGVIYAFDCSLGSAELATIAASTGAVETALHYSCEKDGATAEDYFILGEAREFFFHALTNNLETLEVGEDQKVTITPNGEEPQTAQGIFTYIFEAEAIAFSFDDPSSGDQLYLVYLGDDTYSTLLYIGDAYVPYFTYFPTADVEHLTELFGGDYTTGGAAAKELTFDFSSAAKKVIFGGEEYDFFWDSTIEGDFVLPALSFITDTQFDGGELVGYTYHTVELNGFGLMMTSYPISLAELPDESEEEDLTEYDYFVTKEDYEKIKGSSYTYHGEYYDETFTLDENGVFSISSTDASDSDGAVKMVEYDYFLQHFTDADEKDAFIIAFNSQGNFYVYAYIYNDSYGKIMDMVYTKSVYSDFVGTYAAGESVLVLGREGGITLDGEAASTVFEGNQATFFIGEKNYTVLFAAGKATLTEGSASPVEYSLIKLTPLAFVGTYTLDEDTIVMTTSAISANIAPSFFVTLNGEDVTPTFGVVNGKQVLSFSVMAPPPALGAVEYTLTLDGGKIKLASGTVSAEADACAAGYGSFIFADTKTLDDGSVVCCHSKEQGTVPLFFLEKSDAEPSLYRLSCDGEGTVTLEVDLDGKTLQLILADGELTVQWKPSDIPLPPPPPPAP